MSSSRIAWRRPGIAGAIARVGPRLDVVALVTVLVAAGVARLIQLDLMEFKDDETEACRLALHVLGYSEPGVGRFFPTEGLISSLGVPNGPLFVYLIAVPMAVVRSPLAAATFVAATNILAVWLCYLIGRRFYSRFVGVASAALFALSPWSIVFSRKIWAQDLLPIFAALFLLQLHALLVERRPRSVAWLIILAAGATQLHFSAWILIVPLVAALIIGRDAVTWRWGAAGAAGALALYAPFLVVNAHAILHSLGNASSTSHGLDVLRRFTGAVHFTAAIVGGDNLTSVFGSQSPLVLPLSLVLSVAAASGLLAGWWRARGTPVGRLRALLCVWYALPAVVLTVLPVTDYIHYFIVLFPVPFLGIAHALERITGWRPGLGRAALALALCGFAIVDVGLFRTLVHNGGAPGDYGVGYRYKAAAVDEIVQGNPGLSFDVGTDLAFGPGSGGREYRFLVWNHHPTAKVPADRATTAYVIIETRFPPPLLTADPNADSYPRQRVGPLVIVSVPSAR